MTHSSQAEPSSDNPLLAAITIVVLLFAVATVFGWTTPQERHAAHSPPAGQQDEESPSGHEAAVHHAAEHEETHSADHVSMPDFYAVTPFLLLLGAIAVLPLLRTTEEWWESNLHRFYMSAALAIVTLLYYLLLFPEGGLAKVQLVLEHSVLQEYIPFIVLLFSLYTISGGIRIQGDLPAHPGTNVAFLTVGGLLASFIGTTGAAMLLIRPLLETNAERKHVQHTVVFFIFIVCNCGGCLLPIGDPPLFLGYLEGVDFMWTMWNLWLPWLVVNTVLIAVYYVWDRFFCYPHETPVDIQRDETRTRPIQISGLWPNALLLLGIILSVALLDPNKPFPGTSWHPWLYLREVMQLVLVGLSLWLGAAEVRRANRFNYHAIIEVAALFIGIFICMQPAIEILNLKGPSLGIDTPFKFFWTTGTLSSVLDNAPTYLVFFKTSGALFHPGNFAEMVSGTGSEDLQARAMLIGVSLGAVFMGAMTYIGNGPNFMVRAIAEQSGIRMPSFFGYVIRYSIPVLVPIFLIASIVFLI